MKYLFINLVITLILIQHCQARKKKGKICKSKKHCSEDQPNDEGKIRSKDRNEWSNLKNCGDIIKESSYNKSEHVCGSDGITYAHEDFLTFRNCIADKEEPKVIVQSIGDCVKECPVSNLRNSPVCGSDGHTYLNPSCIKAYNCRMQLHGREKVTVMHKGYCIGLLEAGMILVY